MLAVPVVGRLTLTHIATEDPRWGCPCHRRQRAALSATGAVPHDPATIILVMAGGG